MHHFYEPNIQKGINFLDEEESKHAIKVLRMHNGDIIEVLDGMGNHYKCRIANASKKCEFEVIETHHQVPKEYSIHIAIAPTKNQDRMEWFIEKVTEIGVDEVSFIISKNTEKSRLRMDRIIKKAVGAMKQSMNLYLPKINEEINFSEFIKLNANQQNKFIAYVDENHQSHLKNVAIKSQSALVLIGPEGDFSKDEIEMAFKNGFKPVSLGKSRLRTETAGIVACHTVNLINL